MIEKQTLKEFVDCRTGEVLQYESTKTVRKKVDSENFYMVFNGAKSEQLTVD